MIEVPSVPKIWGEERWIINDNYCGKLLKLKEMHQCSIHYHQIKNETFFILSGTVIIEINDQVFFLIAGCAIDVKAGEKHRFTGLENSEIIEFSSHHEESDSYRETVSQEIDQVDVQCLLDRILSSPGDTDRIKNVYNFEDKE